MIRSIHADRLVLRELEVSDCSDAYIGWLSDPKIARFLETRHARHDTASVIAFIEGVRGSANEFLFGIFLREGGRHIGNIKVGPIHVYHRLADLSLLIGARDCWGHGYAAEAIGAISRYAFAELGVAKLSASMYAPNAGSHRAFLKVGYRQEGVRRSHYRLEGERCDLFELGLLPSDLEAHP